MFDVDVREKPEPGEGANDDGKNVRAQSSHAEGEIAELVRVLDGVRFLPSDRHRTNRRKRTAVISW